MSSIGSVEIESSRHSSRICRRNLCRSPNPAGAGPDDPTTVEVFECCINGQEIAPAYTEQNDPIEQRERLEHQAGGEQQKLDEDFLVALEHGMPPAGGIGIGIDRLCMMLLGQESIRDVILFPQLKPKQRGLTIAVAALT